MGIRLISINGKLFNPLQIRSITEDPNLIRTNRGAMIGVSENIREMVGVTLSLMVPRASLKAELLSGPPLEIFASGVFPDAIQALLLTSRKLATSETPPSKDEWRRMGDEFRDYLDSAESDTIYTGLRAKMVAEQKRICADWRQAMAEIGVNDLVEYAKTI